MKLRQPSNNTSKTVFIHVSKTLLFSVI